MRRSSALLTMVLLATIALSGCGGSSMGQGADPTGSTSASTVTARSGAPAARRVASAPPSSAAAGGHGVSRTAGSAGRHPSATRTSSKSSHSRRRQPLNVVASSYVPQRPAGAMALSSPGFGEDAPLPGRYACKGAVTPTLRWGELPRGTTSLALVATEVSDAGTAVRWLLANVDPSLGAIAEGQTPTGAVVGADAEGHVGYAGVCPTPGKPYTLQFALYALSSPLSLPPGFKVAELEQAWGKALLGATVLKATNG